MANEKPQYKMLRRRGSEEFLTPAEHAPPYLNVEWGAQQLENVSKHHGIPLEEIEVVPITAAAPLTGAP
jgi:hypothetical protein